MLSSLSAVIVGEPGGCRLPLLQLSEGSLQLLDQDPLLEPGGQTRKMRKEEEENE